MTSSNRKLMAITANDLTVRADAQGVERYVAGLSTERPKVHEMQVLNNQPPIPKSRMNTIDMIKGVAKFYYTFPKDNRGIDFSEVDQVEDGLEEQGYKLLHSKIERDEKGLTYLVYFEPRDLVA